ncbi:MAG: hypothetical protein HLX52_09180 [Idiomarinaceae bacterium]|uniref:hypothetical protein n=1 Tax=Idiomarina sp. 28-8 TaxID=1260624 RepID=UPI0002EB8441|nr:hypothetical protein [Idiomarina sp. 28-8]NWO03111.1 hypothetical protein [Idiomarinaceae bacterium]
MSTTELDFAKELIFNDVYLIDSQIMRGTVGTSNDFPQDLIQQDSQSLRAATVEEVINEEGDEKDTRTIIKVLVNLGNRFITDADKVGKKEQEFLFRTPASEVDDDKIVLLEITASYCVDFIAPREFDLSMEGFERFCRSKVLNYIWPFWREHVYSSCAKARVPKFDIPTFFVDDQNDN